MAPLDADARPPRSLLWQRRHAFQRPLHVSQPLAMSAVIVSAATFFLFGVHELPQYMRLTCALLFSLQLFMVVLLFIIISFLDPAHPAVKRRQQQDAVTATESRNLSPSSPAQQTAIGSSASQHQASPTVRDALAAPRSSSPVSRRVKCSLCRVFVSSDTRHCATCNKCVAGFDHHCVYLNTCIGARNYPLFIGLLSCSILLIATQLIVTGFAISRLLHGSHNSSAAVRVAMLCLLSLLPLLQLVCMLVLAAFHLYLWLKGMRTHDFLQQWYRSRSTSSSSSSSSSLKSNKHQLNEREETVHIHIASDRISAETNITSSSTGSTTSNTDQEQVDSARACEPMALLVRQEDPHYDESAEDSEQRHLV
ncbi:putative s-acyltransferase [Globisporangium polare]